MRFKVIGVAFAAAIIILGVTPAIQATFSIVAVDTISGEVGGAGASCISNSFIINDIIESVGAVHTQALYIEQNQDNAHDLLAQGLTPDSIVSWLSQNDAFKDPGSRQYGVVTLQDAASASFTGAGCTYWAGHRTGPGYAIQGNILLGEFIVDTMEFAFLNTEGPIEDRLMAALEAAKVVGADTRCNPLGKSTISSFIKVVRPGDGSTPYLQEVVGNTTGSTDPIDVLRGKFDLFKLRQTADSDSSTVSAAPTLLLAGGNDTAVVTIAPRNFDGDFPTDGVDSVWVSVATNGAVDGPATDNGDGTYSIRVLSGATYAKDTVTASVAAGHMVTALFDQPELTYLNCGDMDGSGGSPDVSDLTRLVTALFLDGEAPVLERAANVNGAGGIDISDLTTLVNHLFVTFQPLNCN